MFDLDKWVRMYWRKVNDETYKWIDKGNELYSLNLGYPTITMNLKGKSAGMTIPNEWHIKYNDRILFENKKAFIANTPAHEVAHLFEWKLYGKCGHKKNWKDIMHRFGFENPCRCHNYE